jgi:hypothetical protein
MTGTTGTFTEAELKEMVEVRRDLHAHPETAFEEVFGTVNARLPEVTVCPSFTGGTANSSRRDVIVQSRQ